jgi:TetR/AcrR family transcriptional regulator, transcriptional repressor for nem operon
MSDVSDAIMDAAERRMRVGGFGGFSFRELAADVGVKSSSVHYYFPTKESLGAAVVRRYTDRLAEKVDAELAKGADASEVFANAFRNTAHSESCMCPMVVMGAASADLPAEVLGQVQRFYRMCLDKLLKQGMSQKQAAEFLSTTTGAMVVAKALGDRTLYDRATAEVVKTSLANSREDSPGASAEGRSAGARSSRRAAS